MPTLYHSFSILVIALSAVICGADSWVEVEWFGESKQDWLAQFLDLTNGIPSHDTFERVFAHWAQATCTVLQGQGVAIDGKTVRRSHNRTVGREAIQMVSAWATENCLVLARTQVDDQSNEITAISALPELPALSGCIVPLDVMGCQKDIAGQIIAQGVDDVLVVKDNQKTLHQDMQDLFEDAQAVGYVNCDYHQTVDKGHGRIEVRECWTTAHPDCLASLYQAEQWPGFQTAVRVRTEWRVGQHSETETRYYMASAPSDVKRILQAVRGHWQIENSLH